MGWLLENYGEGVVAEYLSVRHAVGSDANWRAKGGLFADLSDESLEQIKPTLMEVDQLSAQVEASLGGQSFLDHHAHFHGDDDGHHHHHHHDPDPLTPQERSIVQQTVAQLRQTNPEFLRGFSDQEVIALAEIRRGATATVAFQDLSDALTQLAVRSGLSESSLVRLGGPTANDAFVINGIMREVHDELHHAIDDIDVKRSRSAMLREVMFSLGTGFFDVLYNYLPTWLFGSKSRPVLRSTRVANFFFHWFPFIPGAVTGALGFLNCPEFQPSVTAEELCVATGEISGIDVAYHVAFHPDYFDGARNQSFYINLQGPSDTVSIVERFELSPAHENDALVWRYRSPSCNEEDSVETCHEVEARGISNWEILRQSTEMPESEIQALPQEYRLQISHHYQGEFVEESNVDMIPECIEIPGAENLERDCSPFSQGHVCVPGTPSAEQCCNYCHAVPGLGGHCH